MTLKWAYNNEKLYHLGSTVLRASCKESLKLASNIEKYYSGNMHKVMRTLKLAYNIKNNAPSNARNALWKGYVIKSERTNLINITGLNFICSVTATLWI